MKCLENILVCLDSFLASSRIPESREFSLALDLKDYGYDFRIGASFVNHRLISVLLFSPRSRRTFLLQDYNSFTQWLFLLSDDAFKHVTQDSGLRYANSFDVREIGDEVSMKMNVNYVDDLESGETSVKTFHVVFALKRAARPPR